MKTYSLLFSTSEGDIQVYDIRVCPGEGGIEFAKKCAAEMLVAQGKRHVEFKAKL